jgi:hypothetical protein
VYALYVDNRFVMTAGPGEVWDHVALCDRYRRVRVVRASDLQVVYWGDAGDFGAFCQFVPVFAG